MASKYPGLVTFMNRSRGALPGGEADVVDPGLARRIGGHAAAGNERAGDRQVGLGVDDVHVECREALRHKPELDIDGTARSWVMPPPVPADGDRHVELHALGPRSA